MTETQENSATEEFEQALKNPDTSFAAMGERANIRVNADQAKAVQAAARLKERHAGTAALKGWYYARLALGIPELTLADYDELQIIQGIVQRMAERSNT